VIGGGIATVHVSDLARSVRFYVEVLGFKLVAESPGWAEVDAGGGLRLGLHPAHPGSPRPGAEGSITIGLEVTRPIAEVVAILENRGVRFRGPIESGTAVRVARFGDPDENALQLFERVSC
jgi:catechol 2,3-dioxygenase-like lactoylglutathione lyase family enzyme